MIESKYTVEQFRSVALNTFGFLESMTFHHMPNLEETTSTNGTLIYLGKHVGFIFSLDVRDQCVDAQVVKVKNGEIKRNWNGGYSCNIFTHLVKYAGYRGKSASLHIGGLDKSTLQRMIDDWAQLLKQAGQILLNDVPESLP